MLPSLSKLKAEKVLLDESPPNENPEVVAAGVSSFFFFVGSSSFSSLSLVCGAPNEKAEVVPLAVEDVSVAGALKENPVVPVDSFGASKALDPVIPNENPPLLLVVVSVDDDAAAGVKPKPEKAVGAVVSSSGFFSVVVCAPKPKLKDPVVEEGAPPNENAGGAGSSFFSSSASVLFSGCSVAVVPKLKPRLGAADSFCLGGSDTAFGLSCFFSSSGVASVSCCPNVKDLAVSVGAPKEKPCCCCCSCCAGGSKVNGSIIDGALSVSFFSSVSAFDSKLNAMAEVAANEKP